MFEDENSHSSGDKNNNEIKNKVILGLGWSYAEKFLSQGISLVVSLILARLIEPSKYGILAIISVFITLLNLLAQSGFASALIIFVFF